MKTNQTPSRVNTVNRIDTILVDFVYNVDSDHGDKPLYIGVIIAKDALYKEIMGCVGEEKSRIEELPTGLQIALNNSYNEGFNQALSEIRKSINELFSLQDKGKE